MKIECPKCGAGGEIAMQHGFAANDDENLLTFIPPEGFRKVQAGVFGAILLYCARCGVAAWNPVRSLVPQHCPGGNR